jgi:CubicO group peptidase (beta-lactamase class C family)
MGGVAGHAGVFSTVEDTAIFAQMILNGGRYNGVRILAPLSVMQMTTPQSPVGATDWRGLGFDIRTPYSGPRGDLFPVGSFGHTGFTGTSLWIDPFSEVFVILFTNRVHPDGEGSVIALRKRVASVVAASVMDLPSAKED